MVSSIFSMFDHLNVCPQPPALIALRRSPCALSPHIMMSHPGRTDAQMGGSADGRTDRRKDGQTDGMTEG